jgi:F-box and WD-40 domain protein CDC4
VMFEFGILFLEDANMYCEDIHTKVTILIPIYESTNGSLFLHISIVYSVVLDLSRHQSCSGSMDGNVRVWNIQNGECLRTLTGHTSVVGQLGLSPSYLVSAAADSTLRVWDAEGGQLQHILTAHTGAITCFQHDEFKLLSGSDGDLKLWDVRDGTFVKDLLTGVTSVWQVVFQGWWCVAASNRSNATFLDVWNFRNENDDERLEESESPDEFSDEDIFGDSEVDDDHGSII